MLAGYPVPGEPLWQPGLRQFGDLAEDIGEPSLRVDIVEFGGADDLLKAGCGFVGADAPGAPAGKGRAWCADPEPR